MAWSLRLFMLLFMEMRCHACVCIYIYVSGGQKKPPLPFFFLSILYIYMCIDPSLLHAGLKAGAIISFKADFCKIPSLQCAE